MADPVAAAWPGAQPLLVERVAILEDALASLLAGALSDPEREEARREAHRLAGSLGAFGVASALASPLVLRENRE